MITKLTNNTWIEKDTLSHNIDYNILWNMRPEHSDTVKIFGKEIPIPRLHKVYGIDYTFSGKTYKSEPIPDMFNEIITYFNNKYNRNYNMLLINWYRNGLDYISMHSDNEKQIKRHSEIITLSMGSSRTFVLQNKTTKEKFKYNI